MNNEQQADQNKCGTRVYKKSSLNGKVTIYIGQRDYVGKFGKVDPVDGVLHVDREYVKDKKVYMHLLASFRYGREDLDVLGLTFRKDLYLDYVQLYPPLTDNSATSTTIATTVPVSTNQISEHFQKNQSDSDKVGTAGDGVGSGGSGVVCGTSTSSSSHAANIAAAAATCDADHNEETNGTKLVSDKSVVAGVNKMQLTKLQSRLIQKLGDGAFPFRFLLPHNSPASVTLQPAPEDLGKPCGVDYELKAYIANSLENKSNKKSTVKLGIRKLTYTSPAPNIVPPEADTQRVFKLHSGSVKLRAHLNKAHYNHGEPILVTVEVNNNSTKSIKKVLVQALQIADIMLFTRAMYKCVVDESIHSDTIIPHVDNWLQTFTLCPVLSKNRQKRGLALDGKLRHEDTNLASSTLTKDNGNVEELGIIVSYKVRIRLKFGLTIKHLQVELPFTLTQFAVTANDDDDSKSISESLLNSVEPIKSQDAAVDYLLKDSGRIELKLKENSP